MVRSVPAPLTSIFGPAVEDKMIEGDIAGGCAHADGARVAHPATVGGDSKENDVVEMRAGFFENGADAGFSGAIFDEEMDALD